MEDMRHSPYDGFQLSVYLQPLSKSHVSDYIRIHDRPDIMDAILSDSLIGLQQADDWFLKYTLSRGYQQLFSIWHLKLNVLLGFVGFPLINWEMNSASALYIIENQFMRGKGYATDALFQLVQYGFDILGLSEITCEIATWNSSSIAVAEACGFSYKKSTVRKVRKKDEEVICDVYVLSAEEWRNSFVMRCGT